MAKNKKGTQEMAKNEQTFWGIHAGATGDADNLFLKKNVVALGWSRMGDLSSIKADREAFKKKITENYPDKKPGAIPNNAGQLFRFVHEMKIGDFVIYPSKRDRKVYIGKVESDYIFDESIEKSYPNRRKVKWLKELPRTAFSSGARHEIGSAMSLFQVKNFADEFITALEGKTKEIVISEDEATIQLVAADIQENTRDFIIKRFSKELKGHPFAGFVAHLLETMGYRTRVSPEGPDGGIDIIAHKDELGFEPPIIKVQVKSTEGSVGQPEVTALYGNVGNNEHGLFVALGTFTKQAKNFARNQSNLRIIDGNDLVELVLQHYEKLDSRYKGLIPLKQVYVPELLEESED